LTSGWSLYARLAQAAELNGGGPLAPKPSHHRARAKSLIFVSLTGGFSHVDTFDYKPRLRKDEGKTVTNTELRGAIAKPLLASPFTFRACGKSGLMISDLFPHLGSVADELCVIRSLHTDIVEHFQAVLAMHTGSATVPMPSLGAWLSYGLGTLNANLPSYMVLCEHMPYAGAQVWDNSFLPPYHQGVRIVPGKEPVPNLHSAARSVTLQELEQTMLRDLNERHARTRPDDLNLRARMGSFGTARGMMHEAPEIFELTRESEATRRLYGLAAGDTTSFAAQCLTARRLVEQGVRVVELIDTGSSDNWDAHGNMQDHRPKARRVDQPLAALIRDLKQRGMLDETLVAICTEFGRTPYTDGPGARGRNHHALAFSCLLAGGGVKGGVAYGQTDQYGLRIAADPCHVHDYHATILYLMGIDHERLTYRYAGRDFRLTDVAGRVLRPVLA
ncbi:MAG TPA: DUF1501 domain-containing protein, partial [Gemmataceae bacterium]|nr:DUF1501 domain-containing protein [Gemmataceae bacterium]